MAEVQQLSSRAVFDGRVIHVRLDRVRYPSGQERDFELVRHPGAAAIVPVDRDGNVWMVRQYRYAGDTWLLEVPAGKRDAEEAPEECARREVEEEVGARPRQVVSLGHIWASPGFTDEIIWLFLARDFDALVPRPEPDEVLSLEKVPFRQAVTWALDGRIEDGKSVCALLRAHHYLAQRGERP